MRRFSIFLWTSLFLLWWAIWRQPLSPFEPFPRVARASNSHPSSVQDATPTLSFTVRFHPDGVLYVGDRVSLEVIAPAEMDVSEASLRVEAVSPSRMELGTADFQPYGIAGRYQATLPWVWDTRGLEPGLHSLQFSLQPEGTTWKEVVVLHPEDERPWIERLAHWESATSTCCLVHYITHTDSARHLLWILNTLDDQSQQVAQQLGVDYTEIIPITLLPRLLGHGGFAGEEIYLSYLDRNYASGDFERIVHHEMVHLFDARLGGELRPSFLVEGLAVYLSGGHFKREPLMVRAAALLKLGWYVPLASLVENFYVTQHEIGYLEAGALVQFLVETQGWQAFSRFYRDIHPTPEGKPSAAVEAALQKHFGLNLTQLEQHFLARLRRLSINPDMMEDVRLSVSLYEAVRRYQQQMDPSAYFLTVWLPAAKEMRAQGLVADYLRKPSAPENLALEAMLMDAETDLRTGNYTNTERILAIINAVLAGIERGDPSPFEVHPMAMEYLSRGEPLGVP